MRTAIRRPMAIISCGALVLAGGVAYAASGEGGAASGSTVAAESTTETEASYVYQSSIRRDTINVRDARGTVAPYSVATERRLETWTAPDGSTFARQTCLSAENADPQNGGEADPSNGQACQSAEYRLPREHLNVLGALDGDSGGLAERLEAVAGADPSPVQLASLAASAALSPVATTEQRKAAEGFIVSIAGGVETTGDGNQRVRVSGNDGSVELEFDAETGHVAAYRESTPDAHADRAAVSDRTVTQISTVGGEGEVPAP